MYKLLIVDDEPLVQVGIQSMLKWDELDVFIVGTATNGEIAYEMIEKHIPDIVIADIKMPLMSGLELAKKCSDTIGRLPCFIILTSYEEFDFVKEAIKYQVVDYLVKLELTPEMLTTSVQKSISYVNEHRLADLHSVENRSETHLFKEKFYIRLLNNLFESREQFSMQCSELDLVFDYAHYTCCYMEISGDRIDSLVTGEQLNLYNSSLQMVQEIASKYLPCQVISLDLKHFVMIFFMNQTQAADSAHVISEALSHTCTMIHNYYNVTILTAVGPTVTDPMNITYSYSDARQIFVNTSDELSLVFYDQVANTPKAPTLFNMALFRGDLRRAFDEYNADVLHEIITTIIDLFETHPSHTVQALDAASNLLYLSITLLTDGEEILAEIYSNEPNGYRSLYGLNSMNQIINWLTLFRSGLCDFFRLHNKDYKNHIVISVKKYINSHIEEKLTLNDVATVFGISSNYLSLLFKKNSDIGFNDYITQAKVETAKQLMENDNLKIYEIADRLGYESAFYFSKVFKKVEGVSPREYINQRL